MSLIGYARVSTIDQHPELQTQALEQAGCARIFTEHASGAKTDRPQLAAALDYLRPGDTLVVWKLDRLGRNTRHVLETIDTLKARQIGFRSLTEGLDTSGPMGTVMITVMAAFAQLERDLIVERTRAGLNAAAQRNRRGGRPPKATPEVIRKAKQLRAAGWTANDIAQALNVSRATIYRHLN